MFSSDKKPTPIVSRRVNLGKDAAVTILTSGCHFSGKLYCRGSSRIGGKIEGEIISEGLLIIEESAQITATITADEAVIQGQVKGKLRAKNRVELAHCARFEGDIATPSLVILEGAQFNGRSQMLLAKEVSGGKVLEPVSGFGASAKSPDLKPSDLEPILDKRDPEIAAMSMGEVAQPT